MGDDLRTLAIRALSTAITAPHDLGEPVLDGYADAVLAAVLPAHRAEVLADLGDPEPCPLDHSCEENEPCGCWCNLHDCAIAECPTFKTVESWITGMQQKHEAAMANVRAEVIAEAAEAIDDLRESTDPDDRVARGMFATTAALVRRLAASGPETAPSSTLPAEQPQVPPVPPNDPPAAYSGAQGGDPRDQTWTCHCHPDTAWQWTRRPADSNAWTVMGHTPNGPLTRDDGKPYSYAAGPGAMRREHPEDTHAA